MHNTINGNAEVALINNLLKIILSLRQFFFISWFTDPPTQIFAF